MPVWKRTFDILLGLLLAPLAGMILIAAVVAIRLTSKGPAVHLSARVGRDKVIFMMPKLRTMWIDTPQMATHLLDDPAKRLTPVGAVLRKTSVDELPQIYSVLKGDMSFVGPRPALFNQDDLVAQREALEVNTLTPGITGWAQVNGRDEISIPQKVALDHYYLQNRSMALDLKILWMTAANALTGKDVRH